MSQNMNDIFRNLEGEWSIKRTLGTIGVAEGIASFIQISNNSNVLSYEEKLDVTFFGCPKQSGGHQEYEFIYDAEQDSISKYNSSAHLMYQLKFSDGRAGGVYLCNLDKYVATYRFLDDHKFTLVYEVSGPSKNYSIITEFEKIDDEVSIASSDSSSIIVDSY